MSLTVFHVDPLDVFIGFAIRWVLNVLKLILSIALPGNVHIIYGDVLALGIANEVGVIEVALSD
jgi:hypothetical protein